VGSTYCQSSQVQAPKTIWSSTDLSILRTTSSQLAYKSLFQSTSSHMSNTWFLQFLKSRIQYSETGVNQLIKTGSALCWLHGCAPQVPTWFSACFHSAHFPFNVLPTALMARIRRLHLEMLSDGLIADEKSSRQNLHHCEGRERARHFKKLVFWIVDPCSLVQIPWAEKPSAVASWSLPRTFNPSEHT
jgi:hypothetical protein